MQKLYKYVPMAVAKMILEGSKVGFTKPKYFNDPFDRPAAIPVPTDDPAKKVLASIGAWAKGEMWADNSAILSMTRTAVNPLMWAHYGDSHRGAAIELDVAAAGLADHETNLIPAHFGSVIYVRRFNDGPYLSPEFKVGVVVGETHHFVLEHYEKWQRLFLTKPIDWAYEEEVRVVKCVKGVKGESVETKSGIFTVLPNGKGGEVHALHIPKAAITGVTLGLRATKQDHAELAKLRPDLTYTRAALDGAAYAMVVGSASNG